MFEVKQGVRQGGVLSPWLFLCFDNDIPDVLKSTGYGVTVNDIYCNSVLVADDVTVLSLQVQGLPCMINAINDYSNKWRFQFNPEKTTVVTFGETTRMNNRRKESRKWYLKGIKIKEKHSWEHVGILLNGNFSSHKRSMEAVKKGKAAVYGLMGAGIGPVGLNPICGVTVWKTFGIPAMLYGCEVWSNLSKTETLNRATTFAAKQIQGLSRTRHNARALGTIGMWTTAGYVNKSKPIFCGLLCGASPKSLHKKIFIIRLTSHLTEDGRESKGYISDMMKIFRTYNLYRFVEDYLAHSIFPNKDSWRNIVVEAINTYEVKEWKEQLLRKPGLQTLRRTHNVLKPIIHWEIAKRNPAHRVSVANLVNKLCGNIPDLVFRAVVDCNTFYAC